MSICDTAYECVSVSVGACRSILLHCNVLMSRWQNILHPCLKAESKDEAHEDVVEARTELTYEGQEGKLCWTTSHHKGQPCILAKICTVEQKIQGFHASYVFGPTSQQLD